MASSITEFPKFLFLFNFNFNFIPRLSSLRANPMLDVDIHAKFLQRQIYGQGKLTATVEDCRPQN